MVLLCDLVYILAFLILFEMTAGGGSGAGGCKNMPLVATLCACADIALPAVHMQRISVNHHQESVARVWEEEARNSHTDVGRDDERHHEYGRKLLYTP